MGRGRQKAKHTKVARELKYSVPETDYEKLQRELGIARAAEHHDVEPDVSKWAEYLDESDDDLPRQKLA